MLRFFKVDKFAERIHALGVETDMLTSRAMYRDYDFEEHKRAILATLRTLRDGLGDIPLSEELTAQWNFAEKRIETAREADADAIVTILVMLRVGILGQIERGTFFMLDSSRAGLCDARAPFGDDVADRFPEAVVDVYEGAQCFAFERYTAAVFHLMRAAEYALRSLATELGVDSVEQRDFGQLVQQSRAKHDSTNSRDPAKQRTAEALAGLDLFKDAWRNPVAHARDHYDEHRASDVWNGVRAFMKTLSRGTL